MIMALLVPNSEQRPAISQQVSERYSFTFLAASDQQPASDHAGIGAFTTIPDESQNPNMLWESARRHQADFHFAFSYWVTKVVALLDEIVVLEGKGAASISWSNPYAKWPISHTGMGGFWGRSRR
jgi:hypothetical protein